MPDYLSVKETAEKLDISAAAVRALIQKGELEGAFQSPSRAWLIPAEAVSAYKSSRREKPKSPRKPSTRPRRETTKKEKDEKKKPARKKTSSRRSRKTGLGIDDIIKVISAVLGKSNKPGSGGLLNTLLEQFTNQKRSGNPEQLQSLLASLGQQDPDLLQQVLKSASAPDLAGLMENLKTDDDQ